LVLPEKTDGRVNARMSWVNSGAGKKDDPCPYATLLMLKLASVTQDYRDSESTRNCAEALLHCWEQSDKIHPYMFFYGK
jgi:hypothetical protein